MSGYFKDLIIKINELENKKSINEEIEVSPIDQELNTPFKEIEEITLIEDGIIVDYPKKSIEIKKTNNIDITDYTILCNGQPVFENVKLYMTAQTLVEMLTRGMDTASQTLKKLLDLDSDFGLHYQKALVFKEQLKKTKSAVYEDRLEYTKGKIDIIKEQIKKINQQIIN